MDEYNLYKNAGLRAQIINGRTALVRDVDPNKTSEYGGKTVTNLQRMEDGGAPVDANGNPYELHHINQKADGTLAMLTKEEHDQPGILNTPGIESEVEHGSNWDRTRKSFYKALATTVAAPKLEGISIALRRKRLEVLGGFVGCQRRAVRPSLVYFIASAGCGF